MSIIMCLAIIATVLLALPLGETLFILAFYILYRYDGGTRSLHWYKNFIKNCTIDF